MDGASLPSNTVYNDVPNTNYVAGYTSVSDGSHTIRHTSPISVFGGFLFGRGKWEAYGFPSGMRMSAINTVSNLDILKENNILIIYNYIRTILMLIYLKVFIWLDFAGQVRIVVDDYMCSHV